VVDDHRYWLPYGQDKLHYVDFNGVLTCPSDSIGKRLLNLGVISIDDSLGYPP